MMRIEIITIFPNMFESVFAFGIIDKAQRQGLVEIGVHDLRNFADDRHRTVDDRPFGGGEGMVLKPEPIFRAVESIRQTNAHVVLLSPQGTLFTQAAARRLASHGQLILVCGRYEGVDQRVADHLADEEISVGDFVLTGGELAAMIVTDAVTRLTPGALGCSDSAARDSFESGGYQEGGLDCPHYTRPAEFRGMKVPDVLLSGNHAAIEQWRREQARRRTQQRRPDLGEAEG